MTEGQGRTPDGGIGILGGTFDPIHVGHIAIAEAVIARLKLAKLFLVPAWCNPLKKDKQDEIPGASPDERLAMTYIATKDHPGIYVDPFEIDHGRETGEPSYTIETLEYFRDRFLDSKLVLIVGSDNTNLDEWYRIGDFPRYLEMIAVISRPDFSTDEQEFGTEIFELKNKFPDVFKLVKFLPIANVDVSATDIRASLAAGQVPEEELSPGIALMIKKYGLYGIREGSI